MRTLVRDIVDDGADVLVVGPRGDVLPGARMVRLPRVATPLDGYPVAPPRIRGALRDFAPDVVWVHTLGPVGFRGLVAARRLGVPVLFTWHTDFEAYQRCYPASRPFIAAGYLLFRALGGERSSGGSVLVRGLRAGTSLTAAVIAPSARTAERVHELGARGPVFVLPVPVSGADLGLGTAAARAVARRLPDAPYLVYVGRLSREKNLGLLLDAFAVLAPDEPDAHLVLVGPALDRRTRHLVHGHAALKTGRVVEFGPVPRTCLGEVYRGAAAFVTASLTETQSLSVSEAVATGCPAVVVDAALVADRPPGMVTATAPEPHALAAAMRTLVRAGTAGRDAATTDGTSDASKVAAALTVVRDGADPRDTYLWRDGAWVVRG